MSRLHVVVVVLVVVAILNILRLVRLQQLRSKYALLWMTVCVPLVALAVWPSLADHLADAMGIDYGPSALFLLGIGFLLLVVVHQSWELSRLEARVRDLAEEVALLRLRFDEPEEEHR